MAVEFAKRAKQRPRTAPGGSAPHTQRELQARQGEGGEREGLGERERAERKEGGREGVSVRGRGTKPHS